MVIKMHSKIGLDIYLVILFCFSWDLIIFRRSVLQKELELSHVPEEEQINLLKDLESKETEYMRLKRHKICVDDFDLLTIIGRGAFGEVQIFIYFLWIPIFFFFLYGEIVRYLIPSDFTGKTLSREEIR
jgi:hypothetical protein